MADLVRSQTLARVQGQQQQQLNQQPPFGGPSQQHQPGQPFHDPSSNQPPQSQHPNFMNNPGNPALNIRNASVLQAFQAANAGPDVSRQLNNLILAQQQQQQQQNQQQSQQNNAGGPMNFGARQQQMHAMNQGSSPDTHNLFPPQGMDRRPSPAHPLPLPNNMQPGPQNPMGPMGGQSPIPQQQQAQGSQQTNRRVTMHELTERAHLLRQSIMQQEAMLGHYGNQHRASQQNGGPIDQAVLTKMRQLVGDIKQKKEYLQRMLLAINPNMYVQTPLVISRVDEILCQGCDDVRVKLTTTKQQQQRRSRTSTRRTISTPMATTTRRPVSFLRQLRPHDQSQSQS